MDDQQACELVLGSIGAREGIAADLQALSRDEWDDLIQAANWQSLAPLLYWRIKAFDPTLSLPDGVQQRLRGIYLLSASRSICQYRQLALVLRALHETGIDVVLLKGAHLAEFVYGNIALRPMIDIDILVKQADLARAHETLEELGYCPQWETRYHEEAYFHLRYQHPCGEVIEVHDNLELPTGSVKFDRQDLWARAQRAVLGGIPVRILSTEDLILNLCFHSFVHHQDAFIQYQSSFYAVRCLVDISETLRHYQSTLDWEQLIRRGREWGVANCLYLALRLSHQMLGASVPEHALHAMEPADLDPRLLDWARDRLFHETPDGVDLPPKGWAEFRAAHGFREQLAVLSTIFFPLPDSLAVHYGLRAGSKRVYLYYLVRFAGLVQRNTRKARDLWLHDPYRTAWVEREAGKIALVRWLTSA